MLTNNVTVTAVYRTVDSVGDGIADTWRVAYFGGDGKTTDSRSRADADPDQDGVNNLQEYKVGTSPMNGLSVLRLGGRISDDGMALSFQSAAGYRYRLESTDNLAAPVWEPMLYNITGDGRWQYANFSIGVASNGFYRLTAE